jgi:hypothetical protein
LLEYKLLGQFSTNKEALQNRIDELVQLEEDRLMAYTQFTDYQEQVKKIFDRKAKGKQFQVGDMVLLWDKKNEKSGVHGLSPARIHSPPSVNEMPSPASPDSHANLRKRPSC